MEGCDVKVAAKKVARGWPRLKNHQKGPMVVVLTPTQNYAGARAPWCTHAWVPTQWCNNGQKVQKKGKNKREKEREIKEGSRWFLKYS